MLNHPSHVIWSHPFAVMSDVQTTMSAAAVYESDSPQASCTMQNLNH